MLINIKQIFTTQVRLKIKKKNPASKAKNILPISAANTA